MSFSENGTRNLLEQEPCQNNSLQKTVPTKTLAQEPASFKGAGIPFIVKLATGEPFRIIAKGRVLWALRELIRAGENGCTPIDNPAPRWSAYIHNLRKLGVSIETITEPHGGAFAGHHARYVLRCSIVNAYGKGGEV